MQSVVFGDFKKGREFNSTKFVELSYTYLTSGHNYNLNSILYNALSEYENYIDPKFTYNRDSTFAPIIIDSILIHLQCGISYVMYEKFLKDEMSFRKRSTNTSKKIRKAVSRKTFSKLHKEINNKCPFCTNEEVEYFEIHHINENPSNNDEENLLLLCANCHTKITMGDISLEVVTEKKRSLQKLASNNK